MIPCKTELTILTSFVSMKSSSNETITTIKNTIRYPSGLYSRVTITNKTKCPKQISNSKCNLIKTLYMTNEYAMKFSICFFLFKCTIFVSVNLEAV